MGIKLNLESLETRAVPSSFIGEYNGIWYTPTGEYPVATAAQDAETMAIFGGLAKTSLPVTISDNAAAQLRAMGDSYPVPQTTGLPPQHVDQVMQTYNGSMELAWAGMSMQLTGGK